MKTNAPASMPITAATPPVNPNDIRGLKPPIVIPDVWLWVMGIVVLLAVIAGIIFLFIYFRKKAAEPVPVRIIPPHERARQKLQDALALFSQPQPFCIAVSDTIRVYLEECFHFHAPERTTEEFLHELQATDLLLSGQKESLGEFLSMCDMVKFARYEPGEAELQALHEAAVRLIDETEPPAEPTESAVSSVAAS